MKYYTPRHRRHDRRTDRERTHRHHERRASPDASSGWRDEYRNQRRAVADGGTTDPEDARRFTPEPGARVRDREADLGEGELVTRTDPVMSLAGSEAVGDTPPALLDTPDGAGGDL